MSAHVATKVSKRFRAYSPLELEAEKVFWQGFDPMYFARIAAVVRANESPPEFLDGEENLFGDMDAFQATQRSHLHFLRYLSSETMLLLVGAGYPNGPTLAFLAKAQGRALKQYLCSFASRSVPVEGQFGHCWSSDTLTFEQWLRRRYFGHFVPPADYPTEDLASFLCAEAELVSQRGAVNAMKHGRLMRAVNGSAVSLSSEEGELNWNLEDAVRWLNWSDRSSSSEVTHCIEEGYEEASLDKNMQAITFAALHLRCLRDVRLLALGLIETATAKCPVRDATDGAVQRFVLRRTQTWTDEHP